MKIYLSCVFFISFYCTAGFAQQAFSPGGVKAPVIWYQTDSTAVPAFHSLTAGADAVISLPQAPPAVLMNFHPSLVFNGNGALPVRLPDSSLANATFFIAYQTKSTNAEETVWHITRQNKTTVVFTTSRLADLETGQYMNYRDFILTEPKIGTYTQQKFKDTTSVVRQFWNIGFKPLSPRLPIVSFDGIIPEIIAYDRVLSTEERLKVGSYLAIKYGITLSDPAATYLNSSGDIIWNGLAYPDYYHNIAGIARDDSSRLAQVKATSSNAPGLFTVAAGKPLTNNTSLIWGDNGKPLTKAEKIPGVPLMLKKKWLAVTRNEGRPLQTEITVDTKKIDVPLPANPVYWLAVDRTGKGDFSLTGTEYIRMSETDKDGKAHFPGVNWGLTGDPEVFGITVAQDLLADINIRNAACSDPDGGSISVRIIGGSAPFQIRLTRSAGAAVFSADVKDNKTVPVSNLTPGKYILVLTDARKATYTDSFYINSTDAPGPSAAATAYTLPPGGGLIIRADSAMSEGLSYEWNGPGNFHSHNAVVTLTAAGVYTLTCSNGSCSYVQEISVSPAPTGALTDKNIMVYPNPSNGKFTARIALDQPGDIKMAVYTADGRPAGKPRNAAGRANYSIEGDIIAVPGAYLIEFTSGRYTISKKLIVVN